MITVLRIRNLILVGVLALFASSPASALTAIDFEFLELPALGYVGDGDTLEYEHVFDPFFDNDIEINAIDTAWLYVLIVDDWACSTIAACMGDWVGQGEIAAIDLASVAWASGQATAAIFWGDITAEADLLNNNGTLEVSVTSFQGDFVVLWSALRTTYDYDLLGAPGGGTGEAAVPEPSAALVFAIGTLVVGGRIRRRQIG